MRKSITLCLAGLMLIGLAGCNKAAHNDDVTPNGKEQAAAAGAANNAAAAGAANNAAAAGAANDAAAAGAANGAANAANTANAAAGAAHDVHPGEIPAPADVAAPPADAIKTATGLAYKKLKVNEQGRAIAPTDLVKLHYTGWTTDGHMFDTSTDSPDPVIFTPENLISGMNEAITLAKVGEKVRAWIPQDLAYKGQPGAPAGMLVFDFDIVDVVTPVMPPKNAPEDAVKLPSGVVYKVVKSSPGAKAIDETDRGRTAVRKLNADVAAAPLVGAPESETSPLAFDLVRHLRPGGVRYDEETARRFAARRIEQPGIGRRDETVSGTVGDELRGFAGAVEFRHPAGTVVHVQQPRTVRVRGADHLAGGHVAEIVTVHPLDQQRDERDIRRVVRRNFNHVLVIVRIENLRGHELFLPRNAVDVTRPFPRLIQRRKQHRRENRDDRDHHQ